MNQDVEMLKSKIETLSEAVLALTRENNALRNAINELKVEYYRDNFPDKQIFRKDTFFMGKNSFNGLIGFFGKTPTTQPAGISNPTGGATVDNEARTAINALIAALFALGITA